MTSLYCDLLYGCKLLDFLFFWYFYCMHFLKSFYFLSIASLLCFFFPFFDSTHGISFHFDFYSIREKNVAYFEEFEK
jgi:hypothetical protein